MLMEFFTWGAALSKSNPVAYGILVMVTMAGMGVSIAVIIDIILRLLGVNLGYYKKEFEDQIHH
jgi:uncharacterized membrane protein